MNPDNLIAFVTKAELGITTSSLCSVLRSHCIERGTRKRTNERSKSSTVIAAHHSDTDAFSRTSVYKCSASSVNPTPIITTRSDIPAVRSSVSPFPTRPDVPKSRETDGPVAVLPRLVRIRTFRKWRERRGQKVALGQ